MNYYVYIYKHPISLLPFYVGKGSGDRYKHHLYPCILKKDEFKSRIIKKIRADGLEPIIDIIPCSSEKESLDLEIELIKKFGYKNKGGSLSNYLPGGDSPPTNAGESHPLFGKSGTFKVTNLKTMESEIVTGIYHWAKKRGLNGTTLIDIADKKLRKVIGKNKKEYMTLINTHKGWICERL